MAVAPVPVMLTDLPHLKAKCPDFISFLEGRNIRTDKEYIDALMSTKVKKEKAVAALRSFQRHGPLRHGGTDFSYEARLIGRAFGVAPAVAFAAHAEALLSQATQKSMSADVVNVPKQELVVVKGPRRSGARFAPKVQVKQFRHTASQLSRRLDSEPYAREKLGALLKAYAKLPTPIETFSQLGNELARGGFKEGAALAFRVISGRALILREDKQNPAKKVFTTAALALVQISGKTSREMYAEVIEWQDVVTTSARRRPLNAQSVEARQSNASGEVAFEIFSEIFPTLSHFLRSDACIENVDGLYSLVRSYWPDRASFMDALQDLLDSSQPYDPETTRLKTLPASIAMCLKKSARGETYFPEFEQDRVDAVTHSDSVRFAFIDLVGQLYAATQKQPKQTAKGKSEAGDATDQGDALEKQTEVEAISATLVRHNDAPRLIHEGKSVLIPERFRSYLNSKTPGTNSKVIPIVDGYVHLLEGRRPLFRNGDLVESARKLLGTLKMAPTDIAKLTFEGLLGQAAVAQQASRTIAPTPRLKLPKKVATP